MFIVNPLSISEYLTKNPIWKASRRHGTRLFYRLFQILKVSGDGGKHRRRRSVEAKDPDSVI